MNKISLLTACLALSAVAYADEPKEGPYLEPDPTPRAKVETPARPAADAADPNDPMSQLDWYLSLDYDGYEFEVPAGCVVEKGPKMLIKYPDGTFGVSMTSSEALGMNQKRAVEICRRMTQAMKLPNPWIEKIKCGKAGGAKATGVYEGQNVTVLVLPYDGREITAVMLASPARKEWAEHFIESLKI